jgi:hypothetical protein
VCEDGVLVCIGLEDAAAFAISAEAPVVAEGAGFFLGARDHGLGDGLEGIELAFVDGEIDVEADGSFTHAEMLLG